MPVDSQIEKLKLNLSEEEKSKYFEAGKDQ